MSDLTDFEFENEVSPTMIMFDKTLNITLYGTVAHFYFF
jgi:hypothetical protein